MEHLIQLHERIVILYIVTGWEARIYTVDGDKRTKYFGVGETIIEAIQDLANKTENLTLQELRHG